MIENADKPLLTWEQAVEWSRQQPGMQDRVLASYHDDPLLAAAQRYYNSEEWSTVRSVLSTMCSCKPGAAALDVGAGRGIASYALAREGFNVTALEPDPSALVGSRAIHSLAQESGLTIKVVEHVAEKLPFDDAQFDLVFARAVFHHISDLPAACQEFFRVLRPGGCLIAIREHVISRHEDLPAFFKVHPLHSLYGGEHAYLLREYRSAIRAAGFQLKHVIAPFRSVLNYAPHTRETLATEIAARLGSNPLGTLVHSMLPRPFFWSMAVPLLELVDNRPGRLYSFIAIKP